MSGASFTDETDGTVVHVDVAYLEERTVTIDVVDDEEITTAWLTPDQARQMAEALKRAADRAEVGK